MTRNEHRRTSRRISAVVKMLLALATINLSAATAQAQTAPPAGGGDFASEMARLVEPAAELVPLFRDQVESPPIGQFETLSMWIAAIVMMLSFARAEPSRLVEHEYTGAGAFDYLAALGCSPGHCQGPV